MAADKQNLTPEQVKQILISGSKRARIIHKDEETLESEVISERKIVSEDKKYVVEVKVITTTKRFTIVREYDPEKNYSDTLDEFINKDVKEKE